jgi:hypothetical protein
LVIAFDNIVLPAFEPADKEPRESAAKEPPGESMSTMTGDVVGHYARTPCGVAFQARRASQVPENATASTDRTPGESEGSESVRAAGTLGAMHVIVDPVDRG